MPTGAGHRPGAAAPGRSLALAPLSYRNTSELTIDRVQFGGSTA
ncbi:hypothetical protein [Micromonospora sp. NBC_01412]